MSSLFTFLLVVHAIIAALLVTVIGRMPLGLLGTGNGIVGFGRLHDTFGNYRVALLVGSLAAYGLVRGSFRGRALIEGVFIDTPAGLFEVADGGTLFLDEVGELGLELAAGVRPQGELPQDDLPGGLLPLLRVGRQGRGPRATARPGLLRGGRGIRGGRPRALAHAVSHSRILT